jgi:hypothetical protein
MLILALTEFAFHKMPGRTLVPISWFVPKEGSSARNGIQRKSPCAGTSGGGWSGIATTTQARAETGAIAAVARFVRWTVSVPEKISYWLVVFIARVPIADAVWYSGRTKVDGSEYLSRQRERAAPV